MTNPNSNDLANRQQIQFIKSRGVRVPVKFEIFKHGGGIYLTIQNQNEGVYLGLVGAAANMAAEFRAVAVAIEQAVAVKDQGYISRADVPNPAKNSEAAALAAPRLAAAAPNWDWLSPEMVIKYFEQSPILAPIADDVKAALKGQLGLALPAANAAPPPPPAKSQLDLDLETLQPHLDRIVRNGKVNKSEIARALNLPVGGSGWARIVAIAEALKKAA